MKCKEEKTLCRGPRKKKEMTRTEGGRTAQLTCGKLVLLSK